MSWNTNVWRCITCVFRADALSKVSKLVHQLAGLLACWVHCQFSLQSEWPLLNQAAHWSAIRVRHYSACVRLLGLSVSWELQLILWLGYKIHIELIKMCDLPILYLILLWGLGCDSFFNIYSFPKHLHSSFVIFIINLLAIFNFRLRSSGIWHLVWWRYTSNAEELVDS
jgi:uncharacterized membrane protein YczE